MEFGPKWVLRRKLRYREGEIEWIKNTGMSWDPWNPYLGCENKAFFPCKNDLNLHNPNFEICKNKEMIFGPAQRGPIKPALSLRPSVSPSVRP